jgi:hypothetical protein
MSRTIMLSVVIAAISALVGCGAHGPKQASSAPATTYSTVDCPPPPGGDMQFNFEGAPEKSASRSNQATSMRPNQQERPKSGAVHAAN